MGEERLSKPLEVLRARPGRFCRLFSFATGLILTRVFPLPYSSSFSISYFLKEELNAFKTRVMEVVKENQQLHLVGGLTCCSNKFDLSFI